VWAIVTDPERVLNYTSGIIRWEVAGEIRTGLGARYRVLFRIGGAELGGLVEVVEFDGPCDLAWTSVTGLDHRGRWRRARLPAAGRASSSASPASSPARA
jgi:hypothetical protein